MLAMVMTASLLMAASEPQAERRPGKDTVRVLDGLAGCRVIASDAERLACFDGVAGRIEAARASGDLLVFDRDKVVAERRTRFGLIDVPAGAGEAAAARAAQVREISSTITGVAQAAGYGRWVLTLANGQLWQTLGSDRYGPRAGARIRVFTTVTGGFRASIDGAEAVFVRRIR